MQKVDNRTVPLSCPIGAFITEDPIRDGVNWYSYCGGNPVRYVDPSGETQREDGKYNVETQKKILRYSIEYNEAKAKGDKKGMQEAARKAKNLRVKENEAGFLKDGVAPANWDLATQAAFAGANTAVEAGYFEASSLEYGEFITEFISQFGEKYNEIDAAYDATMASLLIAQISSNMQQCFTEETLVLTQTGYKKIKEVKEGDYVLSENSDTGKKGYKKVVRKFENETNALVHILVDDIEISATESHPFYVCSKGWVCAGDLRIGDKLTTGNSGYVVISSIYKEDLDYSIKVYNLEIEDWHTYFVSENMVLVHNMCAFNQYPLKGKAADEAARKLGYTKIGERSHGQPVYKKGNKYITPDVDAHNGGVWKMADSVKNLGQKSTRMGTYDANLKRIGD